MTTNAELRALAGKATPGPWATDDPNRELVVQPNADGPYIYIADCDSYSDNGRIEENAAYIAAAHPARIIELLNAYEEQGNAFDSNLRELEEQDNTLDGLRAKLEAAEHQIHRLEREIEENSKRTTLISETSARRQAKLDIAMRALSEMECSCHDQQRHESNDHCSLNIANAAQEALAHDPR